MSVVLKVLIDSEEDNTLKTVISMRNLNEKIPCTRIIETSYNIETDSEVRSSLYIFEVKDVDICREVLIMCSENSSFKINNLNIETRINKKELHPALINI